MKNPPSSSLSHLQNTQRGDGEKMMSRRDVIVCRGIWYVMTLVSLFGLSVSLNLLWPPGESKSRFLRDGAVSATTFYAVTLLRCLFFTDPPSPCYKEFTTWTERLPQALFSEIAILAFTMLPVMYSPLMTGFVLSASLFTISLFTGGIGLIQLSDKLRMEIRHALLTLFLGWLFCLFGIYIICSYDIKTQDWPLGIGLACQGLLLNCFFAYSVGDEGDKLDLDTCSAAPVLV